jgi:outer membrane immunogenic protein
MRQIVFGAALAVMVAGSSWAADLSVNAPPPARPADLHSWTGFYIGGHAGYDWGHTSSDIYDSTDTFIDSDTSNPQGAFAGGQVGYNWQFSPNWLVGFETDASLSDVTGHTASCASTGCASSDSKTDAFGTVRGRLGYVMNDVLFYGTGGFAWSHSSTDRTVTCVVAGGGTCPGGPSPSPLTGMSDTASGSQGGWVAGAGVEWKFARRWTAKLEYERLQFDDVSRNYAYAGYPNASRRIVSSTGSDIVMFGVNFLFN